MGESLDVLNSAESASLFAWMHRGLLTFRDGSQVSASVNVDGTDHYNCNCHGFAVTQDNFWISNNDMMYWLDNQQSILTRTRLPQVGGLVVYRENGFVVHSGLLTSASHVTMASGQALWNGLSTTTVPIIEGWKSRAGSNVAIEYWHHSDLMNSEL
jgi:hypothetical protein